MSNQKGMTLIEVTLVISLATVAVVASATYSLPWLSKERARSAVYEVQSYMQLTRIEAVSRNHQCRFVLDTSTRTLQVFDGNGTPLDSSDDTLLYESTLSDQVQFARPDGGAPLSLSRIGSTDSWQVVFAADGSVESGTGEVALYGGEEFNLVSVFGAGGITVSRWDGSGWTNGVHTAQTLGGGSAGSGGAESGEPIDPSLDIDLGTAPIDNVEIVDPQGGSGSGDGYTYDTY